MTHASTSLAEAQPQWNRFQLHQASVKKTSSRTRPVCGDRSDRSAFAILLCRANRNRGGAIPARHLVSQRQLKGVGGDFKLVARLDFDPIRVRKRCGAEEVDVNVPRPPKLGVFEVMMFQVAYGVRHVALSRPERLLPHRPTEAVDTAEAVDIGRQFTKAQFRSQGGLSEL